MSVLSIDFETRSTVDLKKSGVYVYAQHPTTDIWCMAWAFDDEEPEIWTPAAAGRCKTGYAEDGNVCWHHGYCDREELFAGLDPRIVAHILAGGEMRAWNAQFERTIWREIMVKRYGAPEIKMEQFVCSAAEAAAMSLPRALGNAAHVLGVEQQKDDKGYRLMLQMARPRKIADDGTPIWWDRALKPSEEPKIAQMIATLKSYCKQDVRSEKAVVPALRRLTPHERLIYLLDQRINDRGIRIDMELVHAASEIVEVGVTRANARLDDLTNGDVTKLSNHRKLLQWLNEADIETASVSKAAVAALRERDDLAENVQEVLTLRSEAGRSSVAKLKSLVLATCRDLMARGLLLYHGAGTGRWTGKLIQPQNFPRGEVDDIESYIEWVMAGEYDLLDGIAPPVVIVLSMMRSMLTARPGHELIAGDFSAIEARVLNWLAGQEDVVELFRAMDAGDKSRHPYKVMAWKMGRAASPELVKKPSEDYQAGKAAELGCGFQMGWKKFIDAAWAVYQVRVTEEQSQQAVNAYRASHPMVKKYWKDAQNACMDAIREPGSVFPFGPRGNVKATVRGGYLYIVLPSGRPLAYASPSIKERELPWSTEDEPAFGAALHFWGVHPKTGQWVQMYLYGGLIVENIVQAVARDLIADAMLRLEAAGYLPVLSVHDESVCEVPVGFGSLEEFERLMSDLPTWATGCPVAAEAWRGFRYRK